MKEEELAMAYRNAGMDSSRLVRDPAEGVAIAKCLLFRIVGANKLGGVKHRYYHPEPCRFCQVDRKNLQAIYDEWMAWSMLERDGVELPSPVEAFMRLDPERQAQLVRRAQGYVEEEYVQSPTDRVPKSVAEPDQHPVGRKPEDDIETSSEERRTDHPGPTQVRTPGWSIGNVRAPRQQRRRS
jgi:hypothetical protein